MPSTNSTPTKLQDLDVANHFGVSVSSLDRSIAFYEALTGTKVIETGVWESDGLGAAVGGEHAKIHWATFRLGNLNIDLLEVQKPDVEQADYQIAQVGAMHICFEVSDMASAYDRLVEAGIEFKGPWHEITEATDGARKGVGVKVAYFDGPDGEHLELIEPAGPFVRASQL